MTRSLFHRSLIELGFVEWVVSSYYLKLSDRILNVDLSQDPCYVWASRHGFAHFRTVEELELAVIYQSLRQDARA